MAKTKEKPAKEKPAKEKPAAPKLDDHVQARLGRLRARRDEHLAHAKELDRRIADIEAGL